MNKIILPQLLGFRLYGFYSIFKKEIKLALGSGPYIVLGGNGLGKTTTMQAAVYGLAGSFDSDKVEDTKSLRWDHTYFESRLGSYISEAGIEVQFTFGEVAFCVRRGFKDSQITGFKLDDNNWIDDPLEASQTFENAITQYGGYQSIYDFAFLVHRLLYLPESRRLIAWDIEAQLRILMLLNQDVIVEEEFRRELARLKDMDSNKRHIHVAVGKIDNEINPQAPPDQTQEHFDFLVSETKPTEIDIVQLSEQLHEITKRKSKLQQRVKKITANLSEVSGKIEILRAQIEDTEAAIIVSSLQTQESVNLLAIHKLTENGICPVCGVYSPDLQALAQGHERDHLCVLCGSEKPHEADLDLATLRSQLVTKMRAQQELEKDYLTTSAHLEVVSDEEKAVLSQMSEFRSNRSIVPIVERHLSELLQEEKLEELGRELKTEEAQLEMELHEGKTELENKYLDFVESIADRITTLRELYEHYATEFLGLTCVLSDRRRRTMIDVSQFVPKFDEIRRDTQESCSEAQRFFLDIAFRLALIDFACITSSGKATFICETPETALDMSYIGNVVKMLTQFTEKGHSILLSANIQPLGIAEKLMGSVSTNMRASHIADLLEIGRPSKVQVEAMSDLQDVVNRICGKG